MLSAMLATRHSWGLVVCTCFGGEIDWSTLRTVHIVGWRIERGRVVGVVVWEKGVLLAGGGGFVLLVGIGLFLWVGLASVFWCYYSLLLLSGRYNDL